MPHSWSRLCRNCSLKNCGVESSLGRPPSKFIFCLLDCIVVVVFGSSKSNCNGS